MELETLGPAELAKLLMRSEQTIRSDVHRRPHTLPPRFQVPGTRKLVWLKTDVVVWLEKHRARSPRRAA